MKRLMGIVCLVLGIGLWQSSTQVVRASETVQQTSDFEVQAILPEEQVNQDLNYFDLALADGQTKKIQIRVQNFSNHEITVQTQVRNAQTAVGGGFEFKPAGKTLDSSLKTPLTAVVKLNKGFDKVTLKAKEAKLITATVKMPENHFRGMIYGDWNFTEYMKDKAGDDSSVSSNYAYSVGILLQGKPFKVYPELKYRATEPILYSHHAAMGIKLQNRQPMAIKNVTAKATISKNGIFAGKHAVELAGKKIAPNSTFTIPLSWSYEALKPGKYTIDVVVTGENFWNKLPMSWHFKKTVTISKSATENINKQALKKPINTWAYVATAMGGLTLVALTGLLVTFRYRP